jgi:predicted nucleotidyltransferase
MILFGSYAKENVHQYSDVDIAIWNKKFIGEGLIDFELIQPVLRKFRKVNSIDFKMYPTHATADNFDPFIEEIEKEGMAWNPESKVLRKLGDGVTVLK